jgi:ABC-type nickel/cobalt efflux system permease component RcnA
MDVIGWAIFLLAFGAGIVHALDADHVMAVTAIASKKLGMKAIVQLCLKWSLGHGAVLLIIGGGIFIFGLNIPHELSQYAEKGVAVLLIAIGVWILRDLYKSHAHVHFHHHEGLANHAHWHVKESNEKKASHNGSNIQAGASNADIEHKHDHKAVMVGVLHGFAGLAPLLAIIPMANQPVWLGLVYLFIFSLGVFLSMLIFGGLLGKMLERLQGYGVISLNVIRGLIGLASIGLGLAWVA